MLEVSVGADELGLEGCDVGVLVHVSLHFAEDFGVEN